MITKIDTTLPTSTNKKIINTLFTTSLWTHAWDKNSHHNINNPDSGMALMSFQNNETQHTPHPILNVYAGVIFDLVQKNSLIKFKTIIRYYWNWYTPSSKGTQYHTDHEDDNRYSILYNLHTNDGGTIFKVNGKEVFEKSVESQALVFPSKIEHKGVAPTKDLHRLNLNIITQI